ncbi:MAG TPA: TIGR03943 family protein [Anaerolineaceae bacterium]
MRIKTYRTFQALIMAVLGFYLLDKLGGDEIQFYINPRFTLLVLLVTLVFFILAQRILFNRPDDPSTEINQRPVTGSRWAVLSLLMLILPITADLIGQSLPYPVRAMALSGINQAVPLPPGAKIPDFPAAMKPDNYTILDWVWLIRKVPDPAIINGETANVTGFIYHAPGLSSSSFLLVRFVITNSVADLQPVGMQVEWPQSANLADNQWVQVRGEVIAAYLDGKAIPKIRAQSVQMAPDPDMPFIIP